MTTGTRIKQARKKAGMTQAALADKLGISYVGVSQWENDLRNPKLETLRKIALALGTTVSELVEPGYWSTISKEEAEESWGGSATTKAPPVSARSRIDTALGKLNDKGMEKAADTVEVIAEVPQYRAQAAPQSPPVSPETLCTTPTENSPETPTEGE